MAQQPDDIVEQLEAWIFVSPAVCERKMLAACKAEIEALREEVQLWKDRFYSERQGHEATMKAWDEDRRE